MLTRHAISVCPSWHIIASRHMAQRRWATFHAQAHEYELRNRSFRKLWILFFDCCRLVGSIFFENPASQSVNQSLSQKFQVHFLILWVQITLKRRSIRNCGYCSSIVGPMFFKDPASQSLRICIWFLHFVGTKVSQRGGASGIVGIVSRA